MSTNNDVSHWREILQVKTCLRYVKQNTDRYGNKLANQFATNHANDQSNEHSETKYANEHATGLNDARLTDAPTIMVPICVATALLGVKDNEGSSSTQNRVSYKKPQRRE